ncbi:MAG TPA: hypothetical protein VF006_20880 [Longimicrobium sp.]
MRDRPARIPVRVEGTTLAIGLPPALLVGNRMELIEAVTGGLRPGLTRVRLDAAALREIDSAGLGALARVLRESIEATSNPPQLVNARVEIIESMRAVRLLQHFDLRAPEEARWTIRLRRRGLSLARGFNRVLQVNG